MKYFRAITHAQAVSFQKKYQKWPHPDKSYHIFWNYFQNKCNAALGMSLHFSDVTCHLTFKVSAWKRGCTMYFKLKTPQTLSILFLKVPTWKNKFYNTTQTAVPFTTIWIYWFIYNFSITLWQYKYISYNSVISYNRHVRDYVFLRMCLFKTKSVIQGFLYLNK